jgi:hypothetical protein
VEGSTAAADDGLSVIGIAMGLGPTGEPAQRVTVLYMYGFRSQIHSFEVAPMFA